MNVFKHAKIARWSHCNADSVKTLKANYMLIRLLCVYRMTTYIGKILLLNSKRLLKKTANLRGLLFLPHPVCMYVARLPSTEHHKSFLTGALARLLPDWRCRRGGPANIWLIQTIEADLRPLNYWHTALDR